MGLLHVSTLLPLIALLPLYGCAKVFVRSWAAGLFLYQSFDAIDGYVIAIYDLIALSD